MALSLLLSRCAHRRALASFWVPLGLLLAMSGGVAQAAITATGDVSPLPIVQNDDIWIGDQGGVGSLRIDSGSWLDSGYVTIGPYGGIGFATVTDPDSRWAFQGGNIGEEGVGRLEILNRAFVHASGGIMIGQGSAGHGTVAVAGPGTVLRIDSWLDIGWQESVGLLHVADDAIVDVSSYESRIGVNGRLQLAGSLFRSQQLLNEGVITGSGTIQITADGDIYNQGRIEVGAAQYLLMGGLQSHTNNGGTIAVDGGTLEFLGEVQSNADGATISLRNGLVRFATPQQSYERGFYNGNGMLTAIGGLNDMYGDMVQDYEASTVVTNDSTLIFHDRVEIQGGDFTVHPGSTAIFLDDLDLGGTLSLTIGEGATVPIQTGGVTDVWGELQVGFAEGYSPQAGDVFPLLSGPGVHGEFYATDLPSLPFGMLWELNQNSSSIQLQILACPDGDYNGNGVVDVLDYIAWRNTLGSDSALNADGSGNGLVDEEDFGIWKSNFGATAWSPSAPEGAGAAALAAVPEPAAGTLLLVGMVLLACRGRLLRPGAFRRTP